VIFDIGGNIGNNALYWALKWKAKKVYSFEPVPSTFSILQTNIALNGMEKVIIPVNVAIGDVIENLTIQSYSLSNIGGTELRKGQSGTIKAIPLDLFEFPEQRVDLLKIDVERFECEVIKGGVQFLTKFHPSRIFIECTNPARMKPIKRTLASLGYLTPRYVGFGNWIWDLGNRSL
jgi:FkbM family methyltransferase